MFLSFPLKIGNVILIKIRDLKDFLESDIIYRCEHLSEDVFVLRNRIRVCFNDLTDLGEDGVSITFSTELLQVYLINTLGGNDLSLDQILLKWILILLNVVLLPLSLDLNIFLRTFVSCFLVVKFLHSFNLGEGIAD